MREGIIPFFLLCQLNNITKHAAEDKDHAQTKTLLRCSSQYMTSLIMGYNHLVKQMAILKSHGLALRGAHVPQMKDTKQIFALDVDDMIWHDDGLDGAKDQDLPPHWLANDAIQEWISALLKTDCVREQEEWLNKEVQSIFSWLNEEVMDIQQAQVKAEGESIDEPHK